jgi:hypothetical protein
MIFAHYGLGEFIVGGCLGFIIGIIFTVMVFWVEDKVR